MSSFIRTHWLCIQSWCYNYDQHRLQVFKENAKNVTSDDLGILPSSSYTADNHTGGLDPFQMSMRNYSCIYLGEFRLAARGRVPATSTT